MGKLIYMSICVKTLKKKNHMYKKKFKIKQTNEKNYFKAKK